MNPTLLTILIAAAAVVVTMGIALWWWMNRTPTVDREPDGVLPLFGSELDASGRHIGNEEPPRRPTAAPVTPVPPAPPAAPVMPRVEVPRVDVPRVDVPRVDAPRADVPPMPAPPMPAPPERPAPTIRTFDTIIRPARPVETSVSAPAPTAVPTSPETSPVISDAGVPGTMVEGQLLRYSVPAEGTLQFLPGRLQIGAGLDAGREIRFVQVPGPDGAEVTFGRSDGPLYRHIQLRDQTVSRSHARLRFADATWHLLNFSQTNPVAHNGRVLGNGEEQILTDGDRIEMGEVLFTFRSR